LPETAVSWLTDQITLAVLIMGARMAETRTIETKLRVFISYSRKDVAFPQRVFAALETRGIEPKIDTRDLPKLEDWRRELLGFIREADAVIHAFSKQQASRGRSKRLVQSCCFASTFRSRRYFAA
jgi:hypothetical protein